MIDFRTYAEEQAPHEACAFVAGGKIVPVTNRSSVPEDRFRIDPDQYEAVFREHGEITSFLHSHPGGPNYPSKADMEGQIAMGIPWGICPVIDGKAGALFYWGTKERPPLLGRGFRHGVTDCYSLVRDWYLEEKGIDLVDIPRAWEWWPRANDRSEGRESLYLDNYEAAGFQIVRGEEPQKGDLILFKIHSSVPNHGAIYLGDGTMLHHLSGRFGWDPSRLSRREPLARWNKRITHILRYRG